MEPIQLAEPATKAESSSGNPPRNDVTAVAVLREEIDGAYALMRTFAQMDQTEIFMNLAALSSRASEIRTRIVRDPSRRLQTLRTKELDPLLDEIDRQFRFWSRVATIRSQEWEMSGKAI